jgi:hypothetical protein
VPSDGIERRERERKACGANGEGRIAPNRGHRRRRARTWTYFQRVGDDDLWTWGRQFGSNDDSSAGEEGGVENMPYDESKRVEGV